MQDKVYINSRESGLGGFRTTRIELPVDEGGKKERKKERKREREREKERKKEKETKKE